MSEKIVNTSGMSGKGDVFEVVDEVPPGYVIWNIGANMIPGYLPLCRLKQNQPFPGARHIETDTLKAIRAEGAQDILAATIYGPESPEEMERYIRRYEGSENPSVKRRIECYKKAIPALRSIKGVERLSISGKQDYEEDIER